MRECRTRRRRDTGLFLSVFCHSAVYRSQESVPYSSGQAQRSDRMCCRGDFGEGGGGDDVLYVILSCYVRISHRNTSNSGVLGVFIYVYVF